MIVVATKLSIAINSNPLNAPPASIPPWSAGYPNRLDEALLVAGWYVDLTALTLVLAHAGRGLRGASGGMIIVAYALFVAHLLIST